MVIPFFPKNWGGNTCLFSFCSFPCFSYPTRFVKRLYVPLPDDSGRRQLMSILLKTIANNLSPHDIEEIVEGTKGVFWHPF